MLASNDTARRPHEPVDWEKLAGLVGIPQDQSEHFLRWLLKAESNQRQMAELECRVCQMGASDKPSGWLRAEISAEIARTGRAFIRAIERRSLLSTPADLRMTEVVGEYLQDVRAPKRGAPKRDDRFATFLEGLLVVIYSLGGSASVNRKAGTGDIVNLLHELRQHMPEGLIPNALPLSTIERLTAKARKMMDGVPPGSAARILAAVMASPSMHEDEEEQGRAQP